MLRRWPKLAIGILTWKVKGELDDFKPRHRSGGDRRMAQCVWYTSSLPLYWRLSICPVKLGRIVTKSNRENKHYTKMTTLKPCDVAIYVRIYHQLSNDELIILGLNPEYSGRTWSIPPPADSLAPCVAGLSAIMILTMQNKRVILFYEEKYERPVPSHYWEIIENANRWL